MKKLFLIIFLMTISLGQSQTLRLGFESGESGIAFEPFGGFAIQPLEAGSGSNTSMVLPIIASPTGQPWQGTNFVLTSPVELIASKTMTIDVLSSVPVTFLMKVNTGTGPEAAAQASHNGNGTWQTISFTFNTSLDGKAATANGVYNNMVIHPFFPFPFGTGASAQTFYIDNIRGPGVTPPPSSCTNGIQDGTETGIDCGGTCSPCPPPAPAVAVANPTNASEDVISVFSGAYTDVAGTNFYPNWGQNTQYAQYSAAGNATLRYSNLNYQGITFATPVNGSAMTSLHFDIWTPDCASFQMFVLDGSGPEEQVTVTPTLSGWNRYDIPLSSYPNLTKSNLVEFKIVGNGTVYLDNIYFWKAPAGTNTYYADTDGDGFGAGAASLSTIAPPRVGFSLNNTDCAPTNAAIFPGATEVLNGIDDDCDGSIDEGLLPTVPTTDAPTAPARNAWDVQSVYSSAYTNYSGVDFFPNWGQTTTFSTFTPVSNETLKYSNLTYQGIDFNGAKNISAMTKLHLDVWTPNLASFQVVLIAGGENAVTLTPTQSGWNSFDIDLATQYAGRNLTAAIQLKLERTLWTPTDGNVNSLYIDNIYFWRPATGTPPTLGAFTVPAKVVGAANFTLTAPSSNSTGAFTYTSSNTAVATISGSTVTIVGAGSSTITATQAAAGIYNAVSVIATLDVSLAAAAPTPIIPGDRVLSVFSGAAGYNNVAGTNFYPNWGQATQFAQLDVVGNQTLRYSNLNYQGIQLGSVLDISSYDSVHLDIYGAGTSSVEFRVINQVGGAGSSDVAREANTTITLNPGWNSVVIPVSALTTATPGFELNRVGQLMFVGSGTIYVDNIFFSKATPTVVAPTVADVSFCRGLSTQLTATPSGNNPLRWFTVATGGTALLVAPTPTATTTYHVAQVMSNGVVSPRARLVATMVALPTEAVGTITSNTAGTTADTFVAATLAVGPFVGTATTVSYRVPAFVGTNSYFWTVPAGVTIVGQAAGTRTVTQTGANANVLNVNYSGIAAGIGAVGAITVQAQNATGCNGTAKSVAITKALPVAPAAIVMHDLSLPNSPVTGQPVAVRSFAKYMGTNAVLRLTATPSLTATSYEWNLPAGVNQLSGGTSNVITVNFLGVTSGNTFNFNTTAATPVSTNVLRIGVKAVNGVGVSTTANTALVNPTTTSTARLLTLTAVAPAAPTLKMFDLAVSNVVAVTDISKYIGTDTPLALVGTVAATTVANSFSWELADGVNVVAGALTSSTITVNLEDVAPGTASLYVGIKAVNGMGASVKNNSALLPATGSSASLLKLSAGLPSAAGTVVGSLAICSNQASSVTYTITAAAAKTNLYIITSPVGTTIAGGSGNTRTINAVAGATFTVNYPNGFTSVRPTQRTISIQSVNGFGVSATNKLLTLTSNTCTASARNAKVAPAAEDFKVIAYPNPSTGVFNLAIESSKASSTTIQVYDMQGRMIENKQVNTNAVEIGANYTSGIYNVILENAGQAKTIRLIKK